jgi:hypothetical protein
MPRRLLPALLIGVLTTVLLLTAAGRQAAPQTFRSAVTLVPLDVRVIDNKTGQMVTGLRREDFQVIEDRVPQEIRHFEIQALTADPDASARTLSMRGAMPAASRDEPAVSAQRNRSS